MAVPKKRTSKRRKGMRRANDYLTFSKRITFCETCGTDALLHHICESCGYYKGRKIIDGLEDISSNVTDSDLGVDNSAAEATPEDTTPEDTTPE